MEYLEYPDCSFKLEDSALDPMLHSAIQLCLKSEPNFPVSISGDSPAEYGTGFKESPSRTEDSSALHATSVNHFSSKAGTSCEADMVASPDSHVYLNANSEALQSRTQHDLANDGDTLIKSDSEFKPKFNSIGSTDSDDLDSVSHSSVDSDKYTKLKLTPPESLTKFEDFLVCIKNEAADIKQKLHSPISGVEAAELVSSFLTKIEDPVTSQSQILTPPSVTSQGLVSSVNSCNMISHHEETTASSTSKLRGMSSFKKPYRIGKFKHRSGIAKVGSKDSGYSTTDMGTDHLMALDDTLCTSPEYYTTNSYPQHSCNAYPNQYSQSYSQYRGSSSSYNMPTPATQQPNYPLYNLTPSYEQISPLTSPDWAYLAESPNLKSDNGHTFSRSPPISLNGGYSTINSVPPFSSMPSTSPVCSYKSNSGMLPSSLRLDYGHLDDPSISHRYPFFQAIEQPISKATAASDPYSTRRGSEKPLISCQQCGATSTPEWRRGPQGLRTLCNACGLFHAKISRKQGPEVAMRMLKERKKLAN